MPLTLPALAAAMAATMASKEAWPEMALTTRSGGGALDLRRLDNLDGPRLEACLFRSGDTPDRQVETQTMNDILHHNVAAEDDRAFTAVANVFATISGPMPEASPIVMARGAVLVHDKTCSDNRGAKAELRDRTAQRIVIAEAACLHGDQ